MEHEDKVFCDAIRRMATIATEISESKGWYIPDDPEKQGSKLLLMHSEISEAAEWLRQPVKSDHIPDFELIEEEFADIVIRILHFSKRLGLKLPEAILEKLKFNQTRPYKHGWKRF